MSQSSKPARWTHEAALQFSDPVMAEDYNARDPYSPEAFELMSTLMANGLVLDVGCGPGDVAIPISNYANLVDAVDISAAMIKQGQQRPGGDSPVIHWHVGEMEKLAETKVLKGGYGLVTAGDCIHWFDWPTFFPTLKRLMARGASLAMLTRNRVTSPWQGEEETLLAEYDMLPSVGGFKKIPALEELGYFKLEREEALSPILIKKSLQAYIQQIYSRNGFSRTLLGEARAQELATKLQELLEPHLEEGLVVYQSCTRVRYGDVL